MKTSAIFKKPLNDWYSTSLTMGDFKEIAEVELNLLHPNQEEIQDYLVLKKMVDPSLHTDLLVVIVNARYVLINGQHTAAALMLMGERTAKAKIFKVKPLRNET